MTSAFPEGELELEFSIIWGFYPLTDRHFILLVTQTVSSDEEAIG